MPVDLSGKDKRAARRVRSISDDRHREQELKRSRGELACAECNRLKTRCDRKVPCSSCVRRGCQSICPNGTLASGQGNRFVLADTEQLHRKLVDMSERIRQLEDALEIETARSPDRHPLLRDELLAVKRGIGVYEAMAEGHEISDIFDHFGTLTISDDGASRFIGPSGGSESLLTKEVIREEDLAAQSPSPVSASSQTSIVWSFTPTSCITESAMSATAGRLPTWDRAWSLCKAYLEQTSWHVRVVQQKQLIDELLTPIYNRRSEQSAASSSQVASSSRMPPPPPPLPPPNVPAFALRVNNMALLFMVFAMGALADLSLPPYSDEAQQYYEIATSIVNLETASQCPSITMVQVLGMMTQYCALSDRMSTLERGFSLSNFAAIMATSIGLHRDAARWQLDPASSERRRHVFWQIFTMQAWQGLACGRPMMFTLRSTDCEFPEDEGQIIDEQGNVQVGCWRWMYQFAKDILYPVNELACSAGPVKYADILEMDRKTREFAIPKNLQIPPGGSSWENEGSLVVMQRLVPVVWRDISMLYIHRSYFAKALIDHPHNPLRSPFAASFLSAYRCSLALLKVVREHFEMNPDFMIRSWMLWKHVFSALIIVGTIVIRGPNSSLAPAALVELTLGVGFFGKAAEYAQWAKRAFNVLSGVREKAFNTYSQYRGEDPSTAGASASGAGAGSGSATPTLLPPEKWGDEPPVFTETRQIEHAPVMGRSSQSPPSAIASGSGSGSHLAAPTLQSPFTETTPRSPNKSLPNVPVPPPNPMHLYSQTPYPPQASTSRSAIAIPPPPPIAVHKPELSAFYDPHRTSANPVPISYTSSTFESESAEKSTSPISPHQYDNSGMLPQGYYIPYQQEASSSTSGYSNMINMPPGGMDHPHMQMPPQPVASTSTDVYHHQAVDPNTVVEPHMELDMDSAWASFLRDSAGIPPGYN
ncbi:hypothetical protein BD410DRAFT_794903 [Rickenella mellea]|uniref:Zn(2)-C6 fungal-type domain-containing protein n=1 Tax=Rickenella mellea TaxID=50990 RepID=A0A4Y7PQH6_9AGAM|nr:hypothetical protein BD410DRAFT_794903 [Rickenella mellea]